MGMTRIGTISYLNAYPLVANLSRNPQGVELVEGPPSELAQRLRSRDLDVALVPQVEACLSPEYRIVPGPCIACDGPVRSILFFRRVPWSEVKTIAVDRSSNSSVELLRVLRHIDGLPQVSPEEIDPDLGRLEGDDPLDAVLLIGDDALVAEASDWDRDDLGELWKERTDLPFVFALWVGREGLDTSTLELLTSAWRKGIREKADLAGTFVANHPDILPHKEAQAYLSDNITYRLGSKQIESLIEFHRLRIESGADIDSHWHPVFFEEVP